MSQDGAVKTVRESSLAETAKEVVDQVGKDDVPGLAAEISYHLVFSLAPLLIFIVSVAAIVDNYTGVDVSGELRELISERAPSPESEAVLNTLVNNAITEARGGIASFGAVSSLLIALWSGSNAVATLIKAFNRAYNVDEQRGFLKAKGLAVGLTLGLGLFLVLSFVMFVFGGDIGKLIAEEVGLGSVFSVAWNISRYLIAVAFLMLMLALLYWLGPNINNRFRLFSPGTIIATVGWFLAVFGFQVYLGISDPGSAYGVFGGVIVLMLFFFISGLIFLIGAEINAVLEHQHATLLVVSVAPAAVVVPLESEERPAGKRNPAVKIAAVAAAGVATLLVLRGKIKRMTGD